MEYDAAGRMVRVTNDARTQVLTSYLYGIGNERLASGDGSQARTLYVSGAGGVVAEYTDTSGVVTWQKSYIYLGGRLLSTISPNGATERVEFHHPDRLGTRLITAAGTVDTVEQEVLPFGTQLSSTGSGTRRFTSYDRNFTSGLDYAVNRHYDSTQGRFTQVDPIGARASSLSDPQSWNLYTYCGNDPVNHTDPSGLFFKKLFKWIGKLVKAIIVIAAVVAIFVGVLATAGALAPVAGVAFGLKLFAAAAIGLAGAFGPKWLQKAISIGSLAFGALSGAGVFSFAEGGGGFPWGRAATAFGVLQGIGAIANHLRQQGDRRQKRRFSDQFLFEAVLILQFISQHNQARDAGASDEAILCQTYKESRFKPLARNGSHRGPLQINPIAAGEAGLGNGQGKGLSDEKLANVNPDYINNIYDAAQNIRVGTRYLAIRIGRAGGDLKKGLEGFGTGAGYADNILKCADLVKQGRLDEGLAAIYPP